MKGIEHFVELLVLLSLAAEWPSDQARQLEARERARAALRASFGDDYHDLGAANAQRFREDSMSYLRAAWLARQLGGATERYDYEIRGLLPRFQAALPTRGVDQRYTRYGDVNPLLDEADDRYVITHHGDELRVLFNATVLADLRPGFERTFLLVADGCGKDMDLSSAFPDTVEPLPFHGMKSYPYPVDHTYPDDPAPRRA